MTRLTRSHANDTPTSAVRAILGLLHTRRESRLGSLTTGSGFAYGAGYRDGDAFNEHAVVDVWAARSTRLYWATEARLTFPKLAHKRLQLETWAAHREYPEEDFFGIGPDSDRENATDYAIRSEATSARG